MEYETGVVDGKHVLITGPIQGSVTTADGTTVHIYPAELSFDREEDAQEVAHLIGLKHAADGHPHDVEIDDEEDSETFGQRVQRPFYYEPPAGLEGDLKGVKHAGIPSKAQAAAAAAAKKKG